MVDAPQRRRIRLLIPDREYANVAVDAAGELPSSQLQLGDHETTILALAIELLPALHLSAAIVDCYIDQSGATSLTDNSSEPVPVLVELEPLDTDDVPPHLGLSWRPISDNFGVEPGLQTLLDDRIESWRVGGTEDGLRPDWSRSGWLSEASAWITESLRLADRPAPTSIVQFRHWGISAVVRVDQGDNPPQQRSWFKAVCPHFGHEPALTQLLAQHLGGRVASVIAVDMGRRWMLLDDLGDVVILSDAHRHRSEFEHLVSIQRWSAGRLPELVRDGVPQRPLSGIYAAFVEAMADPACAELLGVEPARTQRVTAWLAGAVDRVARIGIPEVLVHGDFHPGNIASDGERHVLFDWSDAAIAPPFVDIVTWAWWLEDDPDEVQAVWDSFVAAWGHAPWTAGLLAERAVVEAVAGAYHFVSYAGIVGNLDRHRRPENALGLRHFFGLTEAVAVAESATRTDLD